MAADRAGSAPLFVATALATTELPDPNQPLPQVLTPIQPGDGSRRLLDAVEHFFLVA